LFLPGNDSQRGRVRMVATRTARELYRLMRDARLSVRATEQQRSGKAFGTAFEGRVDLVLGDPPRILDLKWAGVTRREQALERGTALQLAAYAFLEGQADESFPPVAYFIMERQRLLTTDATAFDGAEQIDGPSPRETWQMLVATHAEAWARVQRGQLDAPGVVLEDGDKPREAAEVVDGRIVVPPGCGYCDFAALCGRAFVEGE
jgi:ATP-dependent helicase/nuclease subunit B